jgi:hypothetical protein
MAWANENENGDGFELQLQALRTGAVGRAVGKKGKAHCQIKDHRILTLCSRQHLTNIDPNDHQAAPIDDDDDDAAAKEYQANKMIP